MNQQQAANTQGILVVDDNPANLTLLTGMLRDAGYRVRAATGGMMALKAAQQQPPDLILLDINMPEMDGYAVCRSAKSNPSLRDVPIIFVSAYNEVFDKVRAFECGGVDYITKPYELAEVHARIATHLKLRQLQKELQQERDTLEQHVQERTLELCQEIEERTLVQARLAEMNRRKDEFLLMLSHELRNPLAPIISSVHILGQLIPGTSQAQRHQDIIERQIRHMARLIDDLLNVSRVTQGTFSLKLERMNLCDAAQQAVETVTPLLKNRETDLHMSVPSEPIWIEGDFTRLVQVFGNLLSNAVKYTDPGDGIYFSMITEENGMPGRQAIVTVRDSGIGISPDLLPHVFELFVQADTSLARTRGGLGVGLTLVRRIIELHDGTVEVSSAGSGKGALFTVRLPLNPQRRREEVTQ